MAARKVKVFEQPSLKQNPPVIVLEEEGARHQRLMEQAAFFYNKKHYREVVRTTEKALEIQPASREALALQLQAKAALQDTVSPEMRILQQADSYREVSDFDAAARLYNEYLLKFPQDTRVKEKLAFCYYNMAITALHQNDCVAASNFFQQTLFIDSSDDLARRGISFSQKCLGGEIQGTLHHVSVTEATRGFLPSAEKTCKKI